MEETGFNYERSLEVDDQYGDGMIDHLNEHDTENYFVAKKVHYNYLSGRFKDDIEHAIGGGSFMEVAEDGTIDYDYAYDHIYKTKMLHKTNFTFALYSHFDYSILYHISKVLVVTY